MNDISIGGLPPTVDTHKAAVLLGISKDLLYELQRRGEAPVEPLRLGRRLRWPTARLLDLIGLECFAAPELEPTGEDGAERVTTPAGKAGAVQIIVVADGAKGGGGGRGRS
jgi:hypothetical protein